MRSWLSVRQQDPTGTERRRREADRANHRQTTAKTIARSEFERLPATEQMANMTAGVTLTD